ncbi:MAG: alpha/beta hydrolase [Planctomycetes bacterium]|nr:alpha/beta hydrolase [Planctomycetota bacterium]
MSQATISEPEPITLEGRTGVRYWIHNPYRFTGNRVVDERFSGYPVAVFLPNTRPAAETPIVIGLQGMSAPYQWNSFLVPTLLDMGIACVLIETPLAGERSVSRNPDGRIVGEVHSMLENGYAVEAPLVPRLMDAVAQDIQIVQTLIRERHGLEDPRLALFGVSLGTLMASFAFMRDGIGTRLLGTLGHADLRSFARSYSPRFTPLIISRPGRAIGKMASLWFGRVVPAGINFLALLRDLSSGKDSCVSANPMTFADRVTADRRVRFLVGLADPLVKSTEAIACARRFADGECYPVPGLGHGISQFGPSFVDHARYFVETQLSDWKQ